MSLTPATMRRNASAVSKSVPPNACAVDTMIAIGSPLITPVPPLATVQRSKYPPCAAWLTADCAMSAASPGPSNAISATCDR